MVSMFQGMQVSCVIIKQLLRGVFTENLEQILAETLSFLYSALIADTVCVMVCRGQCGVRLEQRIDSLRRLLTLTKDNIMEVF